MRATVEFCLATCTPEAQCLLLFRPQLLVFSPVMKTCRSQDDDFSRCHGKPFTSHARAFSAQESLWNDDESGEPLEVALD